MAIKVGIVAGRGDLPRQLVDACRAARVDVFVLALQGEAEQQTVADVPHAWCRLAAGGTALGLLRDDDVTHLVFAGGVRRPSLASLRPDWRAAKFFARVGYRALGDDGLLSAIVKEVEAEGFRVRGAHQLLELLMPEGALGAHIPDSDAQADIERGVRVARTLGALDIGQGVVVQQGLVLGVEAIEGTDALLRRCIELRREGAGGVLVKVEKPEQERRMDLPTIGPDTVTAAKEAGLRGIAVAARAPQGLERVEGIPRA